MFKKILKSYDYTFILVLVLLSIFGLVMVYSSSMVTAVQKYGWESDFFYQKQKLHLMLAAVIFLLMALLPYKIWLNKKFLGVIVFGSLFGLAALFIFGKTVGNAISWFEIGSRSIQPSEFVKIGVIIYLSAIYAKKQSYINEFNKGVIPPIIYLVLVCVLVAIQPDFGTASIIFAIAGTIIISSGMNLRNIMKLVIMGLVIIIPILLIMKDNIFSEERLSRITVLSNPFSDSVAQDAGYHLVNSYIAIGSGGINGLGLGQSVQKLGYLPEAHTDFIMAIIAEELGIWGVLFVLLSLGFLVLRGIYTAVRCRDPFGSLLAIGISSMIGIQSFVNLAGVSGLIPLTGVPIPFVSYGGSSLLQLSFAMGILVNVSMFVRYEQKYKHKQVDKKTVPQKKVNASKYRFPTKA